MKKLMMVLAGALMWGATANAQTDIILRGGFATNQFVGDSYEDSEMNPGYNIGIEFNNYIKDGLYWNSGLLFGSRGYKYSEGDKNASASYKLRAHNLQIPLTIGYKYDLGGGIALDGRIGGFFSADIAGKEKTEGNILGFGGSTETKIGDIEGYKRCDGGLVIGVGLWYQNINLDFAYQRGFAKLYDHTEGGASNFLIRLGYAF